MKVLGIETSGNIGGVAVCEGKHTIIAKDFGPGMQHGKELIPTIRTTLREIGWKPADIDLIAVDAGPGSYTGLRVGISCAKTLAYALNKPVVDVPVFDIIAENYPVNSTPLCPILDAKRKHVYACIYTTEGAQRKRLSEFLVIQPEELASMLPRPVIVFGDGIAPYKHIFHQSDIIIAEENHATPKAKYVALLGERMYEAGHRCAIDTLLPLYLRRPEVVEKSHKI